jgi:hypothetical protein
VNNVQVTPEEAPDSDETPVEGADHDEDKTDLAAFAAAGRTTTHKKKKEIDRKFSSKL